SARYPLVELLTGALFAAVAARFGADWALPAFLVWVAGLVVLSAIDLDHQLLPIRVVYPTLAGLAVLLVGAAALTGRWDDLARAGAGGALGFVLLFLVHFAVPKGMAFGDVRLSGLNGVALGWLGVGYVLVGLFLAFLTSSVIGLALIAAKVRSRKDRIPFGPFLAAGAVLAVFAGGPILRWYGL
ncbi:MAG: leader peptidase (prepilin peptidase) / N-methyltransferase, partial [Acidimicrobiaceae bacterium]|nr:leader peptidase (prepilin peptidase) / N-methyltransferase [Acidimicrobiaceae bacterium]